MTRAGARNAPSLQSGASRGIGASATRGSPPSQRARCRGDGKIRTSHPATSGGSSGIGHVEALATGSCVRMTRGPRELRRGAESPGRPCPAAHPSGGRSAARSGHGEPCVLPTVDDDRLSGVWVGQFRRCTGRGVADPRAGPLAHRGLQRHRRRRDDRDLPAQAPEGQAPWARYAVSRKYDRGWECLMAAEPMHGLGAGFHGEWLAHLASAG